jgi:hypothetical protein
MGTKNRPMNILPSRYGKRGVVQEFRYRFDLKPTAARRSASIPSRL